MFKPQELFWELDIWTYSDCGCPIKCHCSWCSILWLFEFVLHTRADYLVTHNPEDYIIIYSSVKLEYLGTIRIFLILTQKSKLSHKLHSLHTKYNIVIASMANNNYNKYNIYTIYLHYQSKVLEYFSNFFLVNYAV